MNIKLFAYLAITSNYINSSNGINSRIKQPIFKCNSTPNLRMLYNTTYTTTYNDIENNNIISCDEYKTVIFNKNKYKRNLYLRSKEKYTFDENK